MSQLCSNGSNCLITGQNLGSKGRFPQLISDACRGQVTEDVVGVLLYLSAPWTWGTSAHQMEGKHSKDSFRLPWGDPRGGHSSRLGPSHLTS